MLDSNRKLKIGETYLFCTSRTDGDFDNIVNISQFVFYTTSDTAKQIQNQCVASRQSLSIGMTFSEVSGLKGDYISFHYYVFHLNNDGHTIQIRGAWKRLRNFLLPKLRRKLLRKSQKECP